MSTPLNPESRTPSPRLALPPSARDFLIYERLVIDAASTRTVAAELALSQTRIRQIALRVTHWLVETLPTADSDLSDEAKLRLAQHIAADRLEHLYFTASRTFKETTHVKFANLSIRALTALSKYPVIPGTLAALAADAIEGPLPADTNSLYTDEKQSSSFIPPPSSLPPSVPPIRACSPPPKNSPSTPQNPTAPPAATPTAPKPSDNLPPSTRSARAAFFAPAHPDCSRHTPCAVSDIVRGSPDAAPILELKITPEKLGLSTNKPLSRKHRRRLRRLAISKK